MMSILRPIIFLVLISLFHSSMTHAARPAPYRDCAISIRSATGELLDPMGLDQLVQQWGDKAKTAADGFDMLCDSFAKNRLESLPPELQQEAKVRAIDLRKKISRSWHKTVSAPEGTLAIEVSTRRSEEPVDVIDVKFSFYWSDHKLLWSESGKFQYSKGPEQLFSSSGGVFYGLFTGVDPYWMNRGSLFESRPIKGGAEAYPREVERLIILKVFDDPVHPTLGVQIVNLRRHILGDLIENGLRGDHPQYLEDQMLILRPPQKQNKQVK